jgi:cytochrome b involved in lipid metabolism
MNMNNLQNDSKNNALITIVSIVTFFLLLGIGVYGYSSVIDSQKIISKQKNITASLLNSTITTSTSNQKTNSMIIDRDPVQTFTKEELLANHSTQESCYIAYKGQVYDITTFLPSHPGGAKKPLQECGKVVDSFSQIHKGGSFDSPEIQEIINTKIIGSLK